MEENKNEEIKEEKEEVVNEQSQMENNNAEENKKCKSNKPFVIIIVVIAMALTFGCGIMLGKELFESKKSNNNKENEVVDNNQNEIKENEIDNNIYKQNNGNDFFKSIIEDIKNNTYSDSNIFVKRNSEYLFDLYINNKKVMEEEINLKELDNIYAVNNNYLIKTKGSDINSTRLYLFSNNGDLLQEIIYLDKDMVIATSDRYNKMNFKDNIIEVNGTRLESGYCDLYKNKNIKENGDYPVIAEYQLIYSNNKFEIKMVGVIETLSSVIEKYCNE